MPALCRHSLIEFYDCNHKQLLRARDVKLALLSAVRAGNGTIVKSVFHNFSPYGVSGVIVITESHVTIHTWPEHGYAAVDIFSCSRKLNHAIIRRQLKKALGARRVSGRSFYRGRTSATPSPPQRRRGPGRGGGDRLRESIGGRLKSES